MAEDRVFTLIGRFDDQITKHLVAINQEIAALGKGFKTLTRDADNFTRSIRSTTRATETFSQSFRQIERTGRGAFNALNSSTIKLQDSMKGVQGGLQDMKAGFVAASEDSAASIRGIADAFQDVIAAARDAAEAAKGIGADVPQIDGSRGGREGYTVRKGVYANLIAGSIQSFTGAVVALGRTAISAVREKVGEAVRDETSDIASAGGIFSMGKLGKVKWADTYEQAFQVQRELEARMAKLAAALPGDTDDYTRNAKLVSDSVMKMGVSFGPEFIQMMKGFDAAVTDSKSAFLAGTEQLAKYATLTDVISPSGGLPFNALVEQLLAQETINANDLKRRYNAIKKNPLLSGAIDRNLEALNKAAAGTPERFKAMLKLLKEMYPPEVINALQNSVEGITQTMKSSLYAMNTGLFGLKRDIEITDGIKKVKTTLYDAGAEIYAAFGTVINPILEILPKIMDPMKQAGDILAKMYFAAVNTLNNFQTAYKTFAAMRFDGKPLAEADIGFRASIDTIAQLAQAFGADAKKVGDLRKMLKGQDVKYVDAITKGFDLLFSSKAMTELGQAIGKAIGTILSDLAKILSKGGKLLKVSGVVEGFISGWQQAGGTNAVKDLFGMLITNIFKLLRDGLWVAFKSAPLPVTLITGFITGIIPAILGGLTSGITESLSTYREGRGSGGRRGFYSEGRVASPNERGREGMGALWSMFEPSPSVRKQREKMWRSIKKTQQKIIQQTTQEYKKPIGPLPYGSYGDIAGGNRNPFMKSSVNPLAGLSRKLGGLRTGISKGVGGIVPGGAIAMGAMSGAMALAMGENIGTAVTDTIGAVLGGTIGSIFGPAGTLIGSIAGPMIAREIVGKFDPAAKALEAASKSLTQYSNIQGGEKAGGITQILAGTKAKDLPKVLSELRESGKLTDEEFRNLDTSGFIANVQELEKLNKQIDALKKEELIAEAQNLNSLESIRAKREALEKRQQDALNRAVTAWESLSTGLQTKLIRSSDGITRAFDNIVERLGSWLRGLRLPTIPSLPEVLKDPSKALPPVAPSILPGIPNLTDAGTALWNKLFPPKPQPKAKPNYDGAGKAMPLLAAIKTEMANKPTGSDLVIANSSETVIPAFDGWLPKALPAADGNGMGALANGLKQIFGAVGQGFKAVSSQYQQLAGGVNAYALATEQAYTQSERTSRERYSNLTSQMGGYQRQTQQQFAAINGNLKTLASQVAAMSSMGGGFGGGFFGLGAGAGGVSKVIAVGKMLQGMGLNVAENPAFGSGRVGQHAPNSYHYSGRAIDVTGPAALLDEAYAKLKATNPAELLWRTAGHYDHLHVAYALGEGMPAFFSSMKAAQDWERSMVAGSVRVGSITGNSAEGFGGVTTVNIGGVTVHAGNIQDPQELASLVAIEIGNAVSDARAASLFV